MEYCAFFCCLQRIYEELIIMQLCAVLCMNDSKTCYEMMKTSNERNKSGGLFQPWFLGESWKKKGDEMNHKDER